MVKWMLTRHQTIGGFYILRLEPKQYSLHSVVYAKIPENHMLKRIVSIIDFSFINELPKEHYCET